ncbi:hypothetical protein DFQ28_004581 [Apophysomyces sp. BC1034]|nr:hypothetical protein DFQ29_004007 [Apophysomyces sp. BC1021]KAG0188618.1 hypothetical protein DFQ28_004581 [Apophysomyces sp. BC1034]
MFSSSELDAPEMAAISPVHADLPDSIDENIRVLRCALADEGLYVPPRPSTALQDLVLNNMLTFTYTYHGKRWIKARGSELSHIAKSVSIFLEPFLSNEIQRLGSLTKSATATDCGQTSLCTYIAAKWFGNWKRRSEEGWSIEFLSMRIIDSAYVWFDFPAFTLPTTSNTIDSMENGLDIMGAFKIRSLL